MGFSFSDLNPVNAIKKLPKAVESVVDKVEDLGETVEEGVVKGLDKVHDTLLPIHANPVSIATDIYSTVNRLTTSGNGAIFASGLTGPLRQELMAEATDPANKDKQFQGGSTHDLVNKHRTNTPAEMAEGLKGDYTCLEGDIRMETGILGTGLGNRQAIMAHDAWATDGMTLRDWLTIGKASGRMVKMDFKETVALGQAMKYAKELKFDDKKLIFNGGMGLDFTGIRKEFPNATLAINPAGTSDKDLDAAVAKAQEVGKPVIFPIRRNLITPELVEKLKPYGEVAVWGPVNEGETQEEAHKNLRDAGVDGMIDVEGGEPAEE